MRRSKYSNKHSARKYSCFRHAWNSLCKCDLRYGWDIAKFFREPSHVQRFCIVLWALLGHQYLLFLMLDWRLHFRYLHFLHFSVALSLSMISSKVDSGSTVHQVQLHHLFLPWYPCHSFF